jgi:hypothetical protein
MSQSAKKLSFKDMDFKFMAAYNQYSEKYDGAEEPRKEELNKAIKELHEEKISYPDFYSVLENEEMDDRKRFYRAKINTSRKFKYRENERKVDRIRRHK